MEPPDIIKARDQEAEETNQAAGTSSDAPKEGDDGGKDREEDIDREGDERKMMPLEKKVGQPYWRR
jgi:hypothetical protein